MARMLLATAVAVLTLSSAARAAEGDLVQKAPPQGCVAESGDGTTCLDGVALDAPSETLISPDGENVYVASSDSDAIAVFDRDPLTGQLTQKTGTDGCLSETGSGGTCQDVVGLDFVDGIAMDDDGETLYAAGQTSDTLAIFDRDPATGALSQVGCVSETGAGICDDGVALDGVDGVAVSPDGAHVYAVSFVSDAVAIFDRDGDTGLLTQKAGTDGCVSETGTGGDCQDGRGLDGPYPGVLATADGENVYVPSLLGDSIAVFDRDPASGELTQKAGTAGCVDDAGDGVECADARASGRPNFIVEAADGETLYVANSTGNAVTVFDRAASGELTQKADAAGCVQQTGAEGCADGRGLADTIGLGISPDGASLYAAAQTTGAIATFDIDASGAISQRGCVSNTGDGGECTTGTALGNVRGRLSVDPLGRHLYAGASSSDAVAVFDRALNSRPVCAPIDGSGLHDRAFSFTLGCADADDDAITFGIVDGPDHGTLGAIDQAAGKVAYTPAAGYVGTDAFTYAGSDGGGAGTPVTVTITITNTAPSCTAGSAAVEQGSAVTVAIACSDADGDVLALSVTAAPGAGTLTLLDQQARTVTYSAPAAFSGTDSFTVTATDPAGAAGAAVIAVTVSAKPSPSPAPSPAPSPTPSPTPPRAPVTVPITQVATLPSAKRCVSRRRFRIRLRKVRGNKVVRAQIRLNRRTVRTVRGRALSLPIDLRGLPKGRVRVEIITTDSAGRRVVGRRTYRTCVPRRRS